MRQEFKVTFSDVDDNNPWTEDALKAAIKVMTADEVIRVEEIKDTK